MSAATTENEMIAKRVEERTGCTQNHITPDRLGGNHASKINRTFRAAGESVAERRGE
jgi:hypothetical protein